MVVKDAVGNHLPLVSQKNMGAVQRDNNNQSKMGGAPAVSKQNR